AVELHEGARAERVAATDDGIALTIASGRERLTLTGSHLLIAAGRRADFSELDLEAAGIEQRDGRLVLDARLRTTNRRVFVAGDAAGGPCFTHLAGHHAGVVLKNLLFRLPARPERLAVPRVAYTDPELAQVGLTDAAARARGRSIESLRAGLFENDRAQCGREVEGFVKAIGTRRGRILGAGIVGAQAGELILPWLMAVRDGRNVGTLAQSIVPYPTRSEASRRAATAFFLPRLLSERTRRLARLVSRLG